MIFRQLTLFALLPFITLGCSANESEVDFVQKYIETSEVFISYDIPVYRAADVTKKNVVSDAIYKSSLAKLFSMYAHEQQFPEKYVVEDHTDPKNFFGYCWMGKFVTDYKPFAPKPSLADVEALQWLDKKRAIWSRHISKNFSKNTSVKNYCPY